MPRLANVAAALSLVTLTPIVTSAQGLGPNLVVCGAFAITQSGFGSGSTNGVCVGPSTPPGLFLATTVANVGTVDPANPTAPPTINPGPPTVAQQTLATTSGALYQVSFDLFFRGNRSGSSGFGATFGGTTLLSTGFSSLFGPPTPSRAYTFFVTAPSTPAVLAFRTQLSGPCTGFSCDEYGTLTQLTNISVTAVTTPEPATLVLVGGGLLLVGGIARRRRV